MSEHQKSMLDLAPFGRFMTWDPQKHIRQDLNRVAELEADEIFHGAELFPGKEGTYAVPVHKGCACFGLEWVERRDIQRFCIRLPGGSDSVQEIGCEYWQEDNHFSMNGEDGSRWQGTWVALDAEIMKDGDSIVLLPKLPAPKEIDITKYIHGFTALRIRLKTDAEVLRVSGITAESDLLSRVDLFRVEIAPGHKGQRAELSVYNGAVYDAPGADAALHYAWEIGDPVVFGVRWVRPGMFDTNRTLVWIHLPEERFTVAVDDVVAEGSVYVPHAGFYISLDSIPRSMEQHLAGEPGKKTILERVQARADQTFEGAMRVRDHAADRSPTLLSLSCSNEKVEVWRGGVIRVQAGRNFYVIPRFGKRPEKDFASHAEAEDRLNQATAVDGDNLPQRHLEGGWYPIAVTDTGDGPIHYRQRTFVAPYDRAGECQSLGVSEFRVTNNSDQEQFVSLSLEVPTQSARWHCDSHWKVLKDNNTRISFPHETEVVHDGVLVLGDEDGGKRLRAFLELGSATELEVSLRFERIVLAGTLPAGATKTCTLYLPLWECADAEERGKFATPDVLAQATVKYWDDIMSSATHIDIPDPQFLNVIRSQQVRCLIAGRRDGENILPWIAAQSYSALENEAQTIIRAMAWLGHDAFARRSLAHFICKYKDSGCLTSGYTLMGTGWNLWTLAEYYDLSGDREWLKSVAPTMIRGCEWIVRQRSKTKRLNANGKKDLEYGLFPPGVTGDWNRFDFRFYMQAHNCAGMREAARVLADIGESRAPEFAREAAAFREDILRAYDWVQERSPVLKLANDTWVPPYPAILRCFGQVRKNHPKGERGAGSYDVEHGAQHLIALGILEASSRQAQWLVDHFEDVAFLENICNGNTHSAAANYANWFDRGGFSKYYVGHSRTGWIYALRDDVKPFIRSTFNMLAPSLDCENLTIWEHGVIAAPDKTHYAARFLEQVRLMFVMDCGNRLWLAPFLPDYYLREGACIALDRAPTHAGAVSYRISSHVAKGFIEAKIKPPQRNVPDEIVIRLRHPEGRTMQRVFVNGKAHDNFDPGKGIVRIKSPGKTQISVRAEFQSEQ